MEDPDHITFRKIPSGKGKSASVTQAVQGDLFAHELSTEKQIYDHTALINAVRGEVEQWRRIPSPGDWRVTRETARRGLPAGLSTRITMKRLSLSGTPIS
jgi:hypothetical protein